MSTWPSAPKPNSTGKDRGLHLKRPRRRARIQHPNKAYGLEIANSIGRRRQYHNTACHRQYNGKREPLQLYPPGWGMPRVTLSFLSWVLMLWPPDLTRCTKTEQYLGGDSGSNGAKICKRGKRGELNRMQISERSTRLWCRGIFFTALLSQARFSLSRPSSPCFIRYPGYNAKKAAPRPTGCECKRFMARLSEKEPRPL